MYTFAQIQLALANAFARKQPNEAEEEPLSELTEVHLGMMYNKQEVVDPDTLAPETVVLIEKCLP